MGQAAPKCHLKQTKILKSSLARKKARLQTLKRKATWQGSDWQVMPPQYPASGASQAPRQQEILSMDRGPWANLSSPLLLPTCPVNAGDLPERGDQRVLVLHCEFQGHPFWHHKNHPNDKPSAPECIRHHQVGEPPALLGDVLNRVQVE